MTGEMFVKDRERNRRLVNLSAIRYNVRIIRSMVPYTARLMAVVKADAYGHGSTEVAKEALKAGADFLAVATVPEGRSLRRNGISAPILVLGESTGREMEAAAFENITVAVSSVEDIHRAADAAEAMQKPLSVHLKIDTGMGRIGVRSLEERNAVLDAIQNVKGVSLTGVFTHFADADGDDPAYTDLQLERFHQMTDDLPREVLRHCANSAAILRRMPECAFDMVRMGIILYGYPPVPTEADFRMCMEWKTRIMYVKTIAPGESVSYGCTWHADRETRVATVGCGCGDGYHRAASGKAQALVHGVRVPVIGRICMDQMMLDVTEVPDVQEGDPVTLMGHDGEECISAEDIARWAGTISYEVLLAVTGRVKHSFTDDE